MTRSSKIWFVVASVFTLINFAGAIYAASFDEQMHAGAHVALTVVGAVAMWLVARRAGWPQRLTAQHVDQRLEQLQQSVDAIALEVERIGEAQRFNAKVAAERGEAARLKPEQAKRRADQEPQ